MLYVANFQSPRAADLLASQKLRPGHGGRSTFKNLDQFRCMYFLRGLSEIVCNMAAAAVIIS